MTCRWCDTGTCLLCQMDDSICARAEGASSHFGVVGRNAELFVDEKKFDHSVSTLKCPLCKKPYHDLMLHFRNAHPGEQYKMK